MGYPTSVFHSRITTPSRKAAGNNMHFRLVISNWQIVTDLIPNTLFSISIKTIEFVLLYTRELLGTLAY